MAKRTPENYFDPHTEKFVVIRDLNGMNIFGYGPTLEIATEKSRVDKSLEKDYGPSKIIHQFQRTEQTAKHGRYLWQVYKEI